MKLVILQKVFTNLHKYNDTFGWKLYEYVNI